MCLAISACNLTIHNEDDGGVVLINGQPQTCGDPICTLTFNKSETLVLTAAPKAGWTFTGWQGCGLQQTCTLNMGAFSGNKTVEALFRQAPFSHAYQLRNLDGTPIIAAVQAVGEYALGGRRLLKRTRDFWRPVATHNIDSISHNFDGSIAVFLGANTVTIASVAKDRVTAEAQFSVNGGWVTVSRGIVFHYTIAEGAGRLTYFRRQGGQWQQAGTLTIPSVLGSNSSMTAYDDTLLIADKLSRQALIYRFHDTDTLELGFTHLATFPEANDYFGWASAIDADFAVVSGYASGGDAYIYRQQGGAWSSFQHLSPTASGHGVGHGLHLAGNHLFVGDEGALNGNGQIYQYEFDGQQWQWTQTYDGSGEPWGRFMGGDANYLFSLSTILGPQPKQAMISGPGCAPHPPPRRNRAPARRPAPPRWPH